MALDTRSKRASSVGIVSFTVLALVLPDGAIAAADRQHIATSYSGILSNASIEVTPTPASLSLSTFAPSVATPRNVVPSTAALTLSSFAPSVAVDTSVTPTTTALTITTYEPSVVATTHYNAIPSPASLTITTYAPTVQAQGLPTTSVIYGGDDAPRRKKRKKEPTPHDIYQDVAKTVYELLHPEAATTETAGAPARTDRTLERRDLSQKLDELVVLAKGEHTLLQRASRLRAELAQYEQMQRQRILDDDADWEWFL